MYVRECYSSKRVWADEEFIPCFMEPHHPTNFFLFPFSSLVSLLWQGETVPWMAVPVWVCTLPPKKHLPGPSAGHKQKSRHKSWRRNSFSPLHFSLIPPSSFSPLLPARCRPPHDCLLSFLFFFFFSFGLLTYQSSSLNRELGVFEWEHLDISF